MKDDIQHEFGLTLPVTSAKSRNRETPTTPDAAAHLEHPSTGRPPVATFSELLFEQSERPPHVMPTGLMIALLAVSTLESVPPTNVNKVLADIRHNLDWADAELRSVAVTTYSIKHWLQLEMARERVAVFELSRFSGIGAGRQPE